MIAKRQELTIPASGEPLLTGRFIDRDLPLRLSDGSHLFKIHDRVADSWFLLERVPMVAQYRGPFVLIYASDGQIDVVQWGEIARWRKDIPGRFVLGDVGLHELYHRRGSSESWSVMEPGTNIRAAPPMRQFTIRR